MKTEIIKTASMPFTSFIGVQKVISGEIKITQRQNSKAVKIKWDIGSLDCHADLSDQILVGTKEETEAIFKPFRDFICRSYKLHPRGNWNGQGSLRWGHILVHQDLRDEVVKYVSGWFLSRAAGGIQDLATFRRDKLRRLQS